MALLAPYVDTAAHPMWTLAVPDEVALLAVVLPEGTSNNSTAAFAFEVFTNERAIGEHSLFASCEVSHVHPRACATICCSRICSGDGVCTALRHI